MTRPARPSRLLPPLGLALVVAAGCDVCGRRDARTVSAPDRPDLQSVLTDERGGRDRFAAAAAGYRAYLAHHPEDADAHFEMGVLLEDSLADSAEALFHFRVFLDAAPDSEKAALAREYVAKAGKRLAGDAAKSAGRATDSTSKEELTKHIEGLNRRLASLDADRAALSNQVATLERENASLLDDISSLRRMLVAVRTGADVAGSGPRKVPELTSKTLDAPKPTTPAPSPSDSPANRRGTYKVKRGDSLWSIAQLMYGDASRNTDIRRANPGKIGPNDSLTEGDVLIIP